MQLLTQPPTLPSARRKPSGRFRPLIELLEERLAPATVTVDPNAGRHAISSLIYGLNFADQTTLSNLRITLNREGGNTATGYNWQQNASNHANDWFFESLRENGGNVTSGMVNQFLDATRAAGAQGMVTIPLLDWIAKLGPNGEKLASYSQARYGAQQNADWQWFPDAGNGVLTNGQEITWNNPADAYTANTTALQQQWVQYLVNRYGTAANGGVGYYILDNEPGLWWSTHRDVQPTADTEAQLRDRYFAYAAAIRAADPTAKIVGPEEWGWTSYFYSPYDFQYANDHGWGNFPDRQANGNMDFLPWMLQQLKQHDQATGQRTIDVFSLHYYPQGGEYGSDTSTSMQLLRNRSTRSLWDPTYTDQSWINDTVKLIPRMKDWVNTYYPGLQLGLTEYNWGAEGHMNGATTEADVLGILGREGMDLATLWTAPAANTPQYLAFQMYRNYDGNGGAFGETSVSTAVVNPDQVSAFSALRASDGALTVMVVNKNLYSAANPGATTTITIDLGSFRHNGIAQRWQLAAINPADQTHAAITHLSDVTVSGSTLTVTVPMQSVTMFVLKPGTAATNPGQLQFSLAGYRIAESGGSAAVTVTRANGSDGTVTVHYATTNGTATAGSDYTAASGTLTFNPGETTKTFTVAITQDYAAEGTETVNLTLSSPTGGATLGTPATAVLSIVDVPGAYFINFSKTGSPTPGGYVNDIGQTYGSRGGGRTFGWNANNQSNAYDRNSSLSPSELYDSFAAMQGSTNRNAVWQLAVPNGTYTVHLAAGDATAYANTTYKISVEGMLAINGVPTSANRWIENTVTVTVLDGKLTISNASGAANNKIDFIDVVPTARSLAVNAGGSAAGLFLADSYFTGGQTATTTAAIDTSGVTNPAAQSVYQSERYGDFTYTLPGLKAGATYLVRLHFAEIYWTQPGQRTFHVNVNGTRVLSDFDIVAAAGGANKAIVREFTATADANGKISVQFISGINYAKVSGIEVIAV